MAIPLVVIESWVSWAATAIGAVVLVIPLVRVWSTRHASRGKRSGSATFLTRWPGIFLASAAFIAAGFLLWRPVPINLSVRLRWLALLIGIVLYFPGIFLYVWAFATIGAMFGVSSSRGAQLYEGHRLVERGPYHFVRHPMYLGVVLTALGALLIFRTWAMAVFAPSSFGIILRAGREDQLLEEQFGDAWRAYRERVPGWVPRIGKWMFKRD
jgi:protein-S-isoprenylcysteine O-methyltransferase Ste14